MKQKAMLLVVLAAVLWTACTPQGTSEKADPKILTTISIIGDVVQEVAGQNMEVTVLLPPGSDAHGFAPTPQDLVLIAEADLIFISGLGLEDRLADFIEGSSDSTIIIPLSETMQLEGSSDPHVWMNPKNVSLWADRIARELAALDPSHSAEYKTNAEAYKIELDEFDEWAISQIAALDPGSRVLLSDHKVLDHFAGHYEFEILGTLIPGASTLSEPSASELAELERAVLQHSLPTLFVGSPESEDLAAQFAADTGMQIVSIFVESLSEPDGPAPTYLEMMRYDVMLIVNTLK